MPDSLCLTKLQQTIKSCWRVSVAHLELLEMDYCPSIRVNQLETERYPSRAFRDRLSAAHQVKIERSEVLSNNESTTPGSRVDDGSLCIGCMEGGQIATPPGKITPIQPRHRRLTPLDLHLQDQTRQRALDPPWGCTSSGMPFRAACPSLPCSEQCTLRATYGCNVASSRGLHQ